VFVRSCFAVSFEITITISFTIAIPVDAYECLCLKNEAAAVSNQDGDEQCEGEGHFGVTFLRKEGHAS